MRVELADIEVRGRSWAQACATTIENASAYVVSVITVVPSHSLALISAYVSALTGHSAVTHMALPADGHVRFEQRRLGDLAGTSYARACLLDHAAELRALVQELLGEPVTVEIPEASLLRASGVWGSPPAA